MIFRGVNTLLGVALILSSSSTTMPSSSFFVEALVPHTSISKPTRFSSGRLNFSPDNDEEIQKFFTIVREGESATVLEAPVRQDGLKLYIAIDSDSFHPDRPGNGGIRLLHYPSDDHAIDDAIRLAEGMTRKHDQFRTGFSGAKLVVKSDHPNLDEVERKNLMEDAADALHVLCGSVYTGCDLNTCDLDMDYLTEATDEQYVLAGRNSRVDTNVATASSVIGSILGMCEAHEEKLQDLTFTVQGCGKVGSTVAKELVRLGAKRVQTCDLFPESAEIDGCHPIEDWATTPADFLVPCANSLAITEEVAKNFPEGIRYCTGATNSPFASQEAKDIFSSRGVSHVPESISSAGAILADSVEWWDIDLYQTVEPTLMYGWIRSLSKEKAHRMSDLADLKAHNMAGVLSDVTPGRDGDPVGKTFPDWIKENTKKTDTLIIGGGMAGTSTAFGLSQKNLNSILVERGSSVAPPTASSNGDSRMYRQMYSNEFFSKMQTTALKRWREVEEMTGETLLQKNGLLFYGEDTGETVEGSVLGAKQTMENLGLEHSFYENGDDIAEAFPALPGCKGMPYSGVCEDTAGHIKASKACKAMITAAGESCEVHTNSKIVSLDVNANAENNDVKRICATTEDGLTIMADHCVLAAGPWTNEVLKMADLDALNLKVWEIQWAHYKVKKSVADSIPQAFHFRKSQTAEDGGLYYVFPASATESIPDMDDGYTYVKVGVDFETRRGDLEGMETFDYNGDAKVLELMDGWVKEHLPEVGERIDAYTHPYTMTSDSYFVMDNVAEGESLFSGGSGRAFKFAPTIGDMMASLVTGDESPVDLTPFSAKRGALAVEDKKTTAVKEEALEPVVA